MFYLEKNKLEHSVTDWPAFYCEQAANAAYPALKAFYQAGCQLPDTPLEQVQMVALDLETTGLDVNKHSIVSIGLVPFTSKRIFLSQAKYWVVKPVSQLNDNSVVIHGITHSEIETAQDLSFILDEFLTEISGKIVVAHYANIEKSFLKRAFIHRINEGIQFPVIDTMSLEAKICRYRPLSWWDKLKGKQAVSLRLSDARNRYHLPYYKPHHALTDALACAELLQAQIAYTQKEQIYLADIWE
ncbi:3'-5' exonuclease [Catenovulum sp. 2E275]|uniref:3'-5' exonuclease n=1 Tax=Catenovulum sp. 2E275 TaxID=2980497 RepID=UPI0021CEB113|nr:3'-5' exonuclease [Catenovulum sp. 2E275]MCU4674304.1 3'-5' exonuclease [Catenovulum sp. 2E275]